MTTTLSASAPCGAYVLSAESYDLIYGAPERARIEELVQVIAPPQTAESVDRNPAVLADVEIIFSGWGCPIFDADLLAAAPRLRAVFYGAGSIKAIVTDAFWKRGIRITSAWGDTVRRYRLATQHMPARIRVDRDISDSVLPGSRKCLPPFGNILT